MSTKTDLKPWQVLNSKIVHSTPWIEVIEDECQIDGKKLNYTYTKRVDEGPLVIAEDWEENLWMVRQYRHPIKKIIWQFPGEGKHPQESWAEAAHRGLEEELQLKAETLHDLGTFFVDPGGLKQKYTAFLATELTPLKNPKTNADSDEVEHLEIKAFSRAEIDQLITNGEICDNWTLSALFLYDKFRRNLDNAGENSHHCCCHG